MRNLKRALSLALAAAMLISLMVVGASAAEYGDQAQVKQTEAVEVLTGLGVVGGDQNGNFNPTATLTRAEFCVMIANALTGGNFDQTLFSGTDTPFTDVAGHWGAGYIAYCYSNGIVAGTSATTFSPDSTLTAAQAAAILLMALGYNQNNEFAANGQFSLNVTRWAQQAGLYNGLSVSANAGISRENTAKLIFNALVNTTPVGYSTLAESYYTVGTSALTGIVYSGEDLDPAQAGSSNEPYNQTLGYTNFGLKYGAATNDTFDRPAHQWISNSNTDIGTYTNGADLTYTAKPAKADLESALNGYTLDAAVEVNEDGNTASTTQSTLQTNTTIDDTDIDALRALMDNGVLVEIYANRANEITDVVIINTYLAEVTDDYDADNEELSIDVQAAGTWAGTIDNDDFTVSGYVDGDYLLVTATTTDGTNYTIRSVAPATVVEDGALGAYRTNDYVTVNGTQYKYNATSKAASSGALGQDLMAGTRTYSLGEGYNVYLDSYGYAIGVASYTSSIDLSNYVYVGDATANGFNIIAKATFMDGTEQTITISKTGLGTGDLKDVDSESVVTTMAAGKVVKDRFYTFELDRNNNYELRSVADQKIVKSAIESDKAPASITAVADKFATSSTVFITDGTVYTGVANTPEVKSSDVHYLYDGNYLLAVVTSEAGTSSTSSSDLVYILDDTPGVAQDADENTYYVYDAIVDGVKTTLNANQNNKAVGLYEVKTYTDGYADLLDENKVSDGGQFSAGTATGDYAYKDSIMTVTGGAGAGSYILADDVAVYTIDGTTVRTNVSTSSIDRQYDNGFTDYILVAESSTDSTIVAVYLIKPAS